MRMTNWIRSLRAQATLWVVLPLVLVITGMIVIGIFSYQSIMTSIIIERHKQMASLAAVSVSQVIDDYANILTALAGKPALRDESPLVRQRALDEAGDVAEAFNAGLIIASPQGTILTASSDELAFIGNNLSRLEFYVQAAHKEQSPSFSNVISNENSGENFVLITVPLMDEENEFAGALIGGLNLDTASLNAPVQKITVGFNGFAYLVDRRGVVIAHPDRIEIGKKYQERPFIQNVMDGINGGTMWDSPEGDRYVGSNALVPASGWGLIVKEPWESIIAPARIYTSAIAIAGLVAALMVLFLLWRGVQIIITPIQSLSEQTMRLASGKSVEPVARSGILEIDALEQAFAEMAEQIETYREGLRRYVGAITQSQEDERRRISRDLHDETVQGLITIRRRLELFQATQQDPERQMQIAELQEIVDESLRGVRQISQDLRPLVLEDLGLIPALQMLVRSMQKGTRALPDARLEITGEPVDLNPDQELALYRITQEALANVRKHARATGVRVKIIYDLEEVHLEIADDGVGFRVPQSLTKLAQSDNYGLIGIQERVWAQGGILSIETRPGQGTRLCVTISL